MNVSIAATALSALFATFVFLRVPRARRGAWLMALASLSVPGLFALAVWRGDAPLRAHATVSQIAVLETSMREHAREHGCAVVSRNDCEACQPIARLALATAGECNSHATVEIGARALEDGQRCVARGDALQCGMP